MPILALHGFTGCGADFTPLADLCGGDWHCPDLPGHASNPLLDCSPESMMGCIEMQYSKLKQQSAPKILLGYSMGARAALLHASRNPKHWDALILISPNPGIEDETARSERRELDAKLAKRIERDGLVAFLNYWKETPMIRGQKHIRSEWLESMQQNRLKHQTLGLANSLRHFGQGSMPNLWPDIDQLKLPTCLLTGVLDEKYTQYAKRIHQLLKSNSTHTVIDRSSHMPHLENAEATSNVIRTFVENL